MTDPPFGFGLPRDPGEGSGSSAAEPGRAAPPARSGRSATRKQLAEALRQFADLMSWQGGPVNWDLAKNMARQTVAAKGDPSVLDDERSKVTEALRLADLWLGGRHRVPVRDRDAWPPGAGRSGSRRRCRSGPSCATRSPAARSRPWAG